MNRKYRICDNPHSSGLNGKPDKIIVPYDVIEEKKNSYLVERAGWNGKKHRHCIPKNQFFDTKKRSGKCFDIAAAH